MIQALNGNICIKSCSKTIYHHFGYFVTFGAYFKRNIIIY